MNNWIIGVGGSDLDNVYVYTFTGTKEQAKQKLLDMVNDDRDNDDFDDWDYGTEAVDEVEEQEADRLYAFGCWSNYHIDYTATPVNNLKGA